MAAAMTAPHPSSIATAPHRPNHLRQPSRSAPTSAPSLPTLLAPACVRRVSCTIRRLLNASSLPSVAAPACVTGPQPCAGARLGLCLSVAAVLGRSAYGATASVRAAPPEGGFSKLLPSPFPRRCHRHAVNTFVGRPSSPIAACNDLGFGFHTSGCCLVTFTMPNLVLSQREPTSAAPNLLANVFMCSFTFLVYSCQARKIDSSSDVVTLCFVCCLNLPQCWCTMCVSTLIHLKQASARCPLIDLFTR